MGSRRSIAVSGGTGSGKTTLLNALSCHISHEERVITIEDAAELKFDEHPHVVRLEARAPNAEGTGEVTIRELVVNALRMRPDRIIVGECRSDEAIDMLQAMNTGHDGSLTTLHANAPREAVERLVTMVRFAVELPPDAIEAQIGNALDLIVQTARRPGGARCISEIAEVSFDHGRRRCVVRTLYRWEVGQEAGFWLDYPQWVDRLATVRHERLRRTWALAAEGGRGVAHPGLAWRLRHGVSGLRPVAEALLRREPVRRYVLWARMALEQRGYASTSDALLSLVLGACLALLVAGWVVAASPVFGAAVAGCALVALCAAVKSDAERREAALRDEIPDALRSLGVCFRAGLSLMQTLEQTASEMKGPLGELFLSAALVLQTGGTASEALALFRQRADVPELAFVAVALDVQHQSGGSLAAVLDAARESVESEIDLARSLKVQTAQAQLSARIVTAMPFVLIALFSLMSPGFLSPFFESMAGMALLAAALVMQVAGVVLVHRMLDAGGRRL